MKRESIGRIGQGIDGSDDYYLLTLEEQDSAYGMSSEDALDRISSEFRALVYQRCRGPGTRFCSLVSVSPKQYSDSQFIAIAHIRYDV